MLINVGFECATLNLEEKRDGVYNTQMRKIAKERGVGLVDGRRVLMQNPKRTKLVGGTSKNVQK